MISAESQPQKRPLKPQKVSYSFEHHKYTLIEGSAELFQALRTMSWHAKTVDLASDEGLAELTQSQLCSQGFRQSWL